MDPRLRLLVIACSLAAPAGSARAADAPATQPAPTPGTPANLPHIKVDRQDGTVDIDATVCLREGQWLELLACAPKTREYESVLTTEAKPSHIHLALLMLGLEPGGTLQWKKVGDKDVVVPPWGPRVEVSLIYTEKGKSVTVPAGNWITNQQGDQKQAPKPLPDSIWLFSGSSFAKIDGQDVYRADVNGNILSVVNFGDDVLTRPTTMTNGNNGGAWGPITKAIPALKTKVVIRLKPLEKKGQEPAATQPGQ